MLPDERQLGNIAGLRPLALLFSLPSLPRAFDPSHPLLLPPLTPLPHDVSLSGAELAVAGPGS